ncbi:flagellar biosynthesis anti-sigma factor FlgM [Pseudomonas sp. 21LCFQ02]|uniref:flagellar biosynthesis anti-sigma factor FlgM n=1 Tax=Pseudomonas sp. 21LCFQ02 TaxID=2957505 RepID=UPI00209A6F1D|nr:flagellar biosynthesis anti-sigma factor FlgM [Pseudomonas sp. 21LCFQ02]MCO8167308.1 flagellar biosynthesis anti-sigma factor FlgM [Pseudomonas sp. 21LCFQ02]
MPIDFSRLGNSQPLGGASRTGNSREAGKTDVPATIGDSANVKNAGESVHLSSEAQQLQGITDKLRDLPTVNSARVAELKQAIADSSYTVDSNRLASKLLNFEALS